MYVLDGTVWCDMPAWIEAVGGTLWINIEAQLTAHLKFDKGASLQIK